MGRADGGEEEGGEVDGRGEKFMGGGWEKVPWEW